VATATIGYTYLHFLIVAGVVLAAVGIEQAMHHVSSRASLGAFGAAALGGGFALYLVGTSLFALRLTGQLLTARLGLALLLLTGIAPLAVLPALPGFALVVLSGAVVLVTEGRRVDPATQPPARRGGGT